jgi:enediyne biosynthesis protein E4
MAIADFDNDLRPDLAISDIGAVKLFMNLGDGRFARATGSGLDSEDLNVGKERTWTWGLGAADFNLDGLVDLYVAAGGLGSGTGQSNQVFINNGAGRFLDLSAPSRANAVGLFRGVALADYDRDGRMDVFVVSQDGTPRLFRNVTPLGGNHWLELHLVGSASDRDACGAEVVITSGHLQQWRQVDCGSNGLASGSDHTVHVGLGRSNQASLAITWPSGRHQSITAVRADQLATIEES